MHCFGIQTHFGNMQRWLEQLILLNTRRQRFNHRLKSRLKGTGHISRSRPFFKSDRLGLTILGAASQWLECMYMICQGVQAFASYQF